ncbi:MAG TPA: HAD-IIIA family hydrolase [Chlamydiales bacterium]|nr:HAD-IIIA family hydrolase [Chlamydiales bacterium]
MNKALFLDRDGILNQIVMRNGVIGSPRCIEEFKLVPQAVILVKAAKYLGFSTILITNQPDISRALMTRDQLKKIHREILNQIPIDHIEVCTSTNNNYFRRKPNPGMLTQSAQKLRIELSRSFFLGDSPKDIEAGRRAGVKTILYQTDYNKKSHGVADFNCNSFDEITEILKTQKD